jgi:hypothetical protein
MTRPDWDQLARAVRQRRTELGLSQAAVAARGGPSDFVISRIENNDEPRPRADTLRKLDTGLDWDPGTSRQLVFGESPAIRVRVRRSDGQWYELDPNRPAPQGAAQDSRATADALAQQQAAAVGRMLQLPLHMTQQQRDRVEQIRSEILRLPEVLEPWLNTQAGFRQCAETMLKYLNEALDILRDSKLATPQRD